MDPIKKHPNPLPIRPPDQLQRGAQPRRLACESRRPSRVSQRGQRSAVREPLKNNASFMKTIYRNKKLAKSHPNRGGVGNPVDGVLDS